MAEGEREREMSLHGRGKEGYHCMAEGKRDVAARQMERKMSLRGRGNKRYNCRVEGNIDVIAWQRERTNE